MLWITSCISPRLFVHLHRVTEELKVYLNTSCEGPLCVQLKDYDSVLDNLQTYVAQPGVKVWIGTEYTNYALYEIITPEVCRLFILKSCTSLFHHLLVLYYYILLSSLKLTVYIQDNNLFVLLLWCCVLPLRMLFAATGIKMFWENSKFLKLR